MLTEPQSAPQKPPFDLIKWGFMSFQVLAACCESELFPFIAQAAEAGRTVDDIAAFLKFPKHSVRVLLLACCAYGLLRKDSQTGNYFNLLKMDAEYEILRQQVLFADKVVQPAFKFLTASLQSGVNKGVEVLPGPGATLYERLVHAPDLAACLHDRLALTSGIRRAPFLLKAIGDRGKAITHLVDIGGGEGTTAHALSQQYPQMKVTIFDLPSVCQMAAEHIREWGKSDRIAVYPGDMFTDPFPSEVDAIAFVSLLTIFSTEKILELLRKAYDTLPKGGSVIIHTLISNEQETGPLNSANMSLYFTVLASGAGMAYPLSDYEYWLHETGFATLESIKHPQNEGVAVIIATK
jgi:ubiquinone/menaquinone biosynthesis C-methylase UbiE